LSASAPNVAEEFRPPSLGERFEEVFENRRRFAANGVDDSNFFVDRNHRGREDFLELRERVAGVFDERVELGEKLGGRNALRVAGAERRDGVNVGELRSRRVGVERSFASRFLFSFLFHYSSFSTTRRRRYFGRRRPFPLVALRSR
jgi:hypothetical protein